MPTNQRGYRVQGTTSRPWGLSTHATAQQAMGTINENVHYYSTEQLAMFAAAGARDLDMPLYGIPALSEEEMEGRSSSSTSMSACGMSIAGMSNTAQDSTECSCGPEETKTTEGQEKTIEDILTRTEKVVTPKSSKSLKETVTKSTKKSSRESAVKVEKHDGKSTRKSAVKEETSKWKRDATTGRQRDWDFSKIVTWVQEVGTNGVDWGYSVDLNKHNLDDAAIHDFLCAFEEEQLAAVEEHDTPINLQLAFNNMSEAGLENVVDFCIEHELEISIWRIHNNPIKTLQPISKYLRWYKETFPECEPCTVEIHAQACNLTEDVMVEFLEVVLECYEQAPVRNMFISALPERMRKAALRNRRADMRSPLWLRLGANDEIRRTGHKWAFAEKIKEKVMPHATGKKEICWAESENCTAVCCNEISETHCPMLHVNGLFKVFYYLFPASKASYWAKDKKSDMPTNPAHQHGPKQPQDVTCDPSCGDSCSHNHGPHDSPSHASYSGKGESYKGRSWSKGKGKNMTYWQKGKGKYGSHSYSGGKGESYDVPYASSGGYSSRYNKWNDWGNSDWTSSDWTSWTW